MKTLAIIEARDREALHRLYAPGWTPPQDVADTVAAMLRDIRSRGDEAVVAYARKFDRPNFAAKDLRVAMPSPVEAEKLVPDDVAAGLRFARERVLAFHEKQRVPDFEYDEADGSRYAMLVRPLASVGAYVPGGTASLPSSVIMTVVPAKLAGVARIVVTTPPADHRCGVNPAVLYACVLCGADEVYAVGGAQAIAALAFGTHTIAAVDKIVGPGNVWVTEAKRQVFGKVGIDSLAGPSEVLVVADETARADYVAGELLAQAEHDRNSRVAVVSTDRALLERISELLERPDDGGRGEILEDVLRNGTWLIHAADEKEMLDVIDGFAPEHLSVQMRAPMGLIRRVRRAGAIFVGPWTPVAAGDYIAGTNHVLPTAGAARFASGLRLNDFTRTMSLVEYSDARMQSDAGILARLADFEGLPAHARSARMRKR